MRSYLISQHPEVEAKLVAELREHSFLATADQPKPARLQYSDLSQLTYLSWVCKVGCRLCHLGMVPVCYQPWHLGLALVQPSMCMAGHTE